MNLTFPTKMVAEMACHDVPCLVLLLRWCVIIYVHGILDTWAPKKHSALPFRTTGTTGSSMIFTLCSLNSASPWRKCGFRCWTQRSKWSHQKYVRSMTYAITQIVIDFFPSMHGAWKGYFFAIFHGTHMDTSSSTIRNWIIYTAMLPSGKLT